MFARYSLGSILANKIRESLWHGRYEQVKHVGIVGAVQNCVYGYIAHVCVRHL